MPIDPSTLPSAAAGMQIARDQACRSCGYNLVGLQAGGNCPECGATIPLKRFSAKGDNLTDAPASYLHRIALASTISALGMPTAVVVGLFAWMLAWLPLAAVSFLGALGLTAGVVLLTKPRPRGDQTVNDATLDAPAWRLWARAGAGSWLLFSAGMGMVSLGLVNGWGPGALWLVVGWAAFLVACVASVPLLIVIASMADWAGDSSLAGRLRSSAWVLGIGAPVVLIGRTVGGLTTGGFGGFVNIVMIGIVAVYVFALLVGVFGVVQFAGVAVAAVRTNREQHARDQRIAARRASEMRETVDRQFSAPEPVDPLVPAAGGVSQPDTPSPRIFSKGTRIERVADAEVYELEPTDEDPERSP